MTPFKRLFPLLIFLTGLSFTGLGQVTSNPVAEEAVMALTQHQYTRCYKLFSKKVKKAVPKRALKIGWKQLEKTNGSFVRTGKTSTRSNDGILTTTFPFHFEKSRVNLYISVSEKSEIIGFRFSGTQYEIPSWVEDRAFGKERITVKTDTFELEGELMLPPDCDQCPIVVLVHGSGPVDMDGTLGPNKFLLDMAYGLSLNGVGTIRYTKRTKKYGKSFLEADSFTLYDETIADAVSAIKLAKSYEFIDTNRVFVLGHSLGAYAAPLIAKESNNLAGVVMLAGPYRPLYQIVPEQFEFIYGIDGDLTKKEREILERGRQEILLIEGKESEAEELNVLGGEKMLSYYRGLIDYHPDSTIKDLDCPVLIIQGDRDYQVRHETEFARYQSSLSDEEHVYFKLVPGLNHLMIYGTAPSEPSEYSIPEHMTLETVRLISDWVKKNDK